MALVASLRDAGEDGAASRQSIALPVRAPGLNIDTPPARSDLAIPELRTAIHQQWTAEAELRSLNRPEPVALTWCNTGRPVSAPASNVFDGASNVSSEAKIATAAGACRYLSLVSL